MKQIIILLLTLSISCFATAQERTPTTAAEYNYGAVGYRIQLQAGMGDKSGYTITKLEEYEEPERKLEMMGMYRDGESHPCAVIMVYTRIRTAPLYFCMPTNDAPEELWTEFYKSLSTGTDNPQDQLQFFGKCIARLCMKFAWE